MNTRLQVQRKTTPKSSFIPGGRNLLPHRSTEQAEPPLVAPILHNILPTFQAKLTIGQPNDQYEQEADRVADQVMRMPEPKVQRVCPECEEELQRQPMEEEEEETLQTKPLAEQITPLVQRQAEPMEEEEEEETLQTKTTSGQPPTVSSRLQNRIAALRGGGQPLSQTERAFFEPHFGTDFSQVRVHTDSKAAETARAVNARAFTLGRDIVFGAGQYQPSASEGRRLLAHELTHVVQQKSAPQGQKLKFQKHCMGSKELLMMRDPKSNIIEPSLRTLPNKIQLNPKTLTTSPQLDKKTVVGPMDTIDCGGYHWAIRWELDRKTKKGGYVVQMIGEWVNVKDCRNRPVRVQDRIESYDPQNYPFWESWKINKGQTGTGKRIDDSYTWLQGVGEGTKGFMQVRGHAKYYDGLVLPSSFKVNRDSPADLAPMTKTNPNLIGGSEPVLHSLIAEWNCCPGSASKKTKLTPK